MNVRVGERREEFTISFFLFLFLPLFARARARDPRRVPRDSRDRAPIQTRSFKEVEKSLTPKARRSLSRDIIDGEESTIFFSDA